MVHWLYNSWLSRSGRIGTTQLYIGVPRPVTLGPVGMQVLMTDRAGLVGSVMVDETVPLPSGGASQNSPAGGKTFCRLT